MNKIPICLYLLVLLACTITRTQEVRLNHIQVIGSHNSYKIGIEKSLMDLLIAEDPNAIGLDYGHLTLADQLDLGIRGLELDVLYDPEGGAFTQPKGLDILDSLGLPAQYYDTTQLLDPGFKVFHIPDIDFRSHCLTFKGCLGDIRNWSVAHPDHLPILITINPKNSGVNKPGFSSVIPFDQQVLDSFDAEIYEVFESDELITPKMVKGDHSNLRDAILREGWPTLNAVRGKVLFVLDAGFEVTKDYLINNDHAKPMFVNVAPEHPQAGFFIMNDPIKMKADIQRRVQQGFIVRTRSDGNTMEARDGDFSRFEAAKASGAHLISTDYYLDRLSPNQDFEIIFDGHQYEHCNPLFTQPNCYL